jgi:hypothetical protein
MGIRSKALYHYLLKSGVLYGTEEDIAQAKRTYREIYKRQWKQRRRPRKEIRIEFTLKEFETIKAKAMESGNCHTAYARYVILSSIALTQQIPNKQALLKVLQIMSMAAIASAKNIPSWQLSEQLAQAEQMLLHYLKA